MGSKPQDVISLPFPDLARVDKPPGRDRFSLPLEQFIEPEAPNLRDYGRVLHARRWAILAFWATTLLATFMVSAFMTPTYRSVLTLQIDRDTPKVFQFQDVVPIESPADKDFYQTQYELLESRALARRVIEQLRLDENPVFIDTRHGLRGYLSAWFAGVTGAARAPKARMEGLIEHFLDALRIEPVRNSRLVKIAFVSVDPVLSAEVVNTLADSFIQMNLERRVDASSYAKRFLEERLLQVKSKLEESEKQLIVFARRSEIIKLDQNQTIVAEKLRDMTGALTAAEQERIGAQALNDEMESGDNRGFGRVLDNLTLQQLKQRRADLEAQHQEHSKVFKPGYPKMQQISSQIEQVESKINEEIGYVRDAVRSEFRVAKAKEQSLRREMNRLKQEVLAFQDRSIEYNILQREVDTNRQLYDGLLQRMKEVGVAAGVSGTSISIVDTGEVSVNPYRPNIPLNMAVALLVGLMGGVALAFVMDHIDDTIKNPEDLE